jgi:hypothetical protein
MSLPACEQWALDGIEAGLKSSEPRLASMFAIFTRLARDEEQPRTERLPAGSWWPSAWPARLRAARRRDRRRRSVARRRAGRSAAARLRTIVLVPLAVAAALAGLLVLGVRTSGRACVPVIVVRSSARAVRSCLAGQLPATHPGSHRGASASRAPADGSAAAPITAAPAWAR